MDEAVPSLEFWFEFASPYSYVAAERLPVLCARAGVRLVYRPFSLGPIFALQGWTTSHFNLNERRGAYMWRDMERLCEKFGLPWRRPSVFPRNTVAAARVAAAFADEPWLEAYVRACYRANFGDDVDVGDESIVRDLLVAAGQPRELVARANEPARRSMLRANTDRAIALGIFGAPNCVVGTELFWGEESLDDAIAWARR